MEIVSSLKYAVGYPQPDKSYLIVDPLNLQIALDKEGLVLYAFKMFAGLFRAEPEENFWCEGYSIAYAGPFPEVRKP